MCASFYSYKIKACIELVYLHICMGILNFWVFLYVYVYVCVPMCMHLFLFATHHFYLNFIQPKTFRFLWSAAMVCLCFCNCCCCYSIVCLLAFHSPSVLMANKRYIALFVSTNTYIFVCSRGQLKLTTKVMEIAIKKGKQCWQIVYAHTYIFGTFRQYSESHTFVFLFVYFRFCLVALRHCLPHHLVQFPSRLSHNFTLIKISLFQTVAVCWQCGFKLLNGSPAFGLHLRGDLRNMKIFLGFYKFFWQSAVYFLIFIQSSTK